MTFLKNLNNANWKSLFLLLLMAWLGLNILQSCLTEIIDDESYYAFWGERLAWGYYDHPPMVALMTGLSAWLFEGNLSVRFLTVLAQLVTLSLIWRLCDERRPTAKKVLLFFIFPASLIMFSAYGFITTPDAPLLLFTALFLFVYQRFMRTESWGNTLLLALSMAGMMYSKYHAVLIIGLIVLSNLRLLGRYKFWLAGILAAGMLVPHLLWHISEGFPSFQYHLSARSSGFAWEYLFEYWPNQLVVFNPLALGAVIYILFKYRPRDTFERGLYALLIGFFTFFWLIALRGHVEPHWTVVCSIPMIVLLYRYSLRNRKLLRFVRYGIAPFVVLVLVMRIVLVTSLLPGNLGFHSKRAQFKAVESVAGDLPVVYGGSFQRPSLYHFFTQKESTVLSFLTNRQTQFDIWQNELQWQDRPVFIYGKYEGLSQRYEVGTHAFDGFVCGYFQSVNRVKITYELASQTTYSEGDTLCIEFEIFNSQPSEIDFFHAELPLTLYAVYAGPKVRIFEPCEWSVPTAPIQPQTSLKGRLEAVVPRLPKGDYTFGLSLGNRLGYAANSAFVKLHITSEND